MALFDENLDAIFPGGSSAEDTRESGAGFGRELQPELKSGIADALGQVNERNGRARRGKQEMSLRLLARIKDISGGGGRSFDQGKIDGHADFQDVHPVLRL